MENVQDKYRKVLVESLVLDDDVAVEAQVREILD